MPALLKNIGLVFGTFSSVLTGVGVDKLCLSATVKDRRCVLKFIDSILNERKLAYADGNDFNSEIIT